MKFLLKKGQRAYLWYCKHIVAQIFAIEDEKEIDFERDDFMCAFEVRAKDGAYIFINADKISIYEGATEVGNIIWERKE